MAKIVSGEIGPEASYDVEFTAGALVASVTYKGKQASAGLSMSVSAADLIAGLESHVTNPMEKAALDVVAALIARIP